MTVPHQFTEVAVPFRLRAGAQEWHPGGSASGLLKYRVVSSSYVFPPKGVRQSLGSMPEVSPPSIFSRTEAPAAVPSTARLGGGMQPGRPQPPLPPSSSPTPVIVPKIFNQEPVSELKSSDLIATGGSSHVAPLPPTPSSSLFPLPLPLAPTECRRPAPKHRRTTRRRRRRRARRRARRGPLRGATLAVTTLNEVEASSRLGAPGKRGGGRRPRASHQRVGPLQAAAVEHIVESVERSGCLTDDAHDASAECDDEKRGTDTYFESLVHAGKLEKLTATNVSVPGGGDHDLRVPIAEAMEPGAYQYLLKNLRKMDEEVATDVPLAFHNVLDGEYPALIHRLVAAGVVSYSDAPPHVVCGLFGVPKGEKLRLLVDARPANAMHNTPPPPGLPSITSVAKLGTLAECRLYGGALDLSQFFHRLLLPPELAVYFGLPVVVDEHGVMRYLVWATAPMGWSWSPWIAQSAHCYQLSLRCLEYARASHFTSVVIPQLVNEDRPLSSPFIDDLIALATSVRGVNSFLRAARAAEPFVVHPDKYQEAVEGKPLVFWGLTLNVDGTITPRWEKVRELVESINAALGRRWVSVAWLQSTVGRLLWPCMLHRGLLSLMDHLFIQARSQRRAVRLWPSTRLALKRLVVLLPLIVIDPARQAGTAVATDSSTYGGAVCLATERSAEVYWDHAHLTYYKGRADLPTPEYHAAVATAVEAHRFKDAFDWRWRDPEEHITPKEARALVLGMERVLLRSGPGAVPSRNLYFNDNQPVVCAFTKGRSSNKTVNSLIRRATCMTLATGSSIDMIWTPTDLMVADEGSRRHSRVPVSL